MATTIQVSETTRQLLEYIKEREEASSYDQVIQHLAKTHAHVPRSMFGAAKGARWKRQDRAQDHDW